MIEPSSINPLALPSLSLADRRLLPNCMAVYLVLEGKTVIYVGQSASLVLRWQQHHKLKQLKSRGTKIKVAWLECSDRSLLIVIESVLIKHFVPELNRIQRCEEVPPKTSLVSAGSFLKKAKPYEAKHSADGKFESSGSEPIDSPVISLRMTKALYAELEEVTGKQKAAFVREAIAEKLKRLNKSNELP